MGTKNIIKFMTIILVVSSIVVHSIFNLTPWLITLLIIPIVYFSIDYLHLQNQLIKDVLTNVYNREYFVLYFNKIIMFHIKHEIPLSILMIDIDYFKSCNDNCGHDIGDIILKNMAQLFKDNVRYNDIIIRYGGEEFIIILPGTTESEAMEIAERIRINASNNIIKIQNKKCDHPCKKNVSIGVADLENIKIKNDPLKLVTAADNALYQAKRTRNTVCSAKDVFNRRGI